MGYNTDKILRRLGRLQEAVNLLLERQSTTNLQLEKLMALADDLKASLQKINDATTKVANRLTDLTNQLRDRSLTEEQRAEVLGQIDELAAHLDAMGQDPANPVPPEPAAMTRGKARP